MISKFYTTTFTVKRMVYTGNKSELTQVATFDGHFQQASAELKASVADTYKLDYIIWCARDSNVQAGDALVDGSNQYTVAAVQDNADGDNAHYELHIRKA